MSKDIGHRYARALLEASGKRNETEQARAALDAICAAVASTPALEQVLRDPGMRTQRLEVFLSLAQKVSAPDSLTTLLRVLEENDRLDDLREIGVAFARLADEKAGRVNGEVKSAVELSAAD